ncbi:MAG: hypothetical protein HFJ98_00090 [Eubacterium sp.]|nr:hypothetical protein [Eubacterium sp.]
MKKVLSVFLSVIMLLSVTTGIELSAYADEYDDKVKETEILFQQIANATPKKLELDVSELEFAKADFEQQSKYESIIEESIENSWKKSAIDMNKFEELFSYWFVIIHPIYYGSTERFRTCQLIFSPHWGKEYSLSIDLVFNNSKNFNLTDEKYAKALKVEKQNYIEVDLDYLNDDNVWQTFYTTANKSYTNSVKKESIEIIYSAGVGLSADTINLYTCDGTYIGIFNKDILYDIRPANYMKAIPVVNIPSSVSDKDTTNYAIKLIKDTYPDEWFTKNIIGIESGFIDYQGNKTDYPNGYTFYSIDNVDNVDNDAKIHNYIVINKEIHTHTWDNGKVTKAATATTAGVKTYTCTKCKATKTEAIPATGLKTPTLKAAVNANGSFTLSWNKVSGAEKYELYIKQADGSYKLMKTTTGTSFTTAFATYGKQFTYKMRAVAGNVKSAYSAAVNATNTKKLQTPAMKVTVNANGTFKLSWNKVTGADKYELYIKQADGSYKLMKTTTGTSFTTAFATYGKQFSYKMKAVSSKNKSIASAYSAVVNAKNTKKLQTPAMKVTVNANGTFKLSWNKVAGADKYELYIKQANGSYKLMKTTTATSFTTAFATYGKQFSYKMRAVNSKNKSVASAYSSVVNAKNTKKLQTPSLKVAVNKNGSFKLSWGKVTGATSYQIYMKQSNGSYKLIKTTSSTSFTTAVAAKGKTYSYKVRAVTSKNKNATSSYSKVVSVKRK